MDKELIRYWSHGPHYQFSDSVVFISWRLAGTLPQHVLHLFNELSTNPHKDDNRWACDKIKQNNAYLFQKFLRYDAELASLQNPDFSLNDPQVARIITGAFQYFAGQRYELHAFCVMPNHVHLLIRALLKSYDEYYHMADIVQSLKSFTSRKINNHLGRKGQVWDHFYFDRVVSDLSSYENVVQYIMINPVKAKLVRNIEDWKYSFFDPKYLKKL